MAPISLPPPATDHRRPRARAALRESRLHPGQSGARLWLRQSPGCWVVRSGSTIERAAATARSQDKLAAVIERLNGELDKLLENAPSLVIMQHAARISSIRKRISALNMLLKSIQRRIDNVDRIVSTGVASGTAHVNDHSSPVQFQSLK